MHNVQCSEHLYCMRQLVELYHSTSQKITDESLRSLIEGKRTAALKALQFDLLFNIKNYNLTKKGIEEFKTMGIYPYENGRISGNKNWRQFLINIIYRLFRHEHLYLLMCKLLSKKEQG